MLSKKRYSTIFLTVPRSFSSSLPREALLPFRFAFFPFFPALEAIENSSRNNGDLRIAVVYKPIKVRFSALHERLCHLINNSQKRRRRGVPGSLRRRNAAQKEAPGKRRRTLSLFLVVLCTTIARSVIEELI